jgi:hypothetical protein
MEKGKERGLEIRENCQEKLGERFCGVYRFPGVGTIFGTAAMARRTGRRDHGVRGIPGTVADRGAVVARVGAGLNAGGAGGIRTRAPRVREGDGDQGFEGGK